ncbi:MAG: molybdopterin-dependent oxidoreductase [Candidatus Eremiobacteraeota bacterium]|nr:molybdopterin-dependent oxidoreductase [Candidatus Eremiobacteraeota bacterium]MCW5867704.1 molybdopterin-dependent oxidoreductase [Candidatus Eremiobacteraeota bacterium]
MNVVTQNPLNAEPSWEDFREPITPHFFNRNHYEFPLVADELQVCGRPFRLEQLRNLPVLRQEVTLECAGNGRKFMDPLPPGTAWGWRGVSNAAWTGVPLPELLKLAPPPEGTLELVFQGGDVEYARSLPLQDCYDHNILVAYSMNDQPLAVAHGGPLRLIVPRYYAMASVKWLTEIRATATPFQGYYQVEDYQFKPISGPARPVSTMLTRAMIVSPQDDESVSGAVSVRGWAWSGFAPVASVRVVVDGQEVPVQLAEDRGPFAWRGFSARVDLAAGEHEVYAVSRDSRGNQQPMEAEWNSQGYENNSVRRVRFSVS